MEFLKKYKEGVYQMGRCIVSVSVEDGLWHLIVAGRSFSPSTKEIKEARYKFIPNDVTMAELYPQKEILKGNNPNERHLWEIYLKF